MPSSGVSCASFSAEFSRMTFKKFEDSFFLSLENFFFLKSTQIQKQGNWDNLGQVSMILTFSSSMNVT